MTYTLPYYDYLKSTHKEMNSMKDMGNIISVSTQEVDELSFMEPFNFPDLKELKVSLKRSGNYTLEQVEEIIAGLSTLPEYNNDKD